MFHGFQSEEEAREAGTLCRYVVQCRGKQAAINDYIDSCIKSGPPGIAKLVDYIVQSKLSVVAPLTVATSMQTDVDIVDQDHGSQWLYGILSNKLR